MAARKPLLIVLHQWNSTPGRDQERGPGMIRRAQALGQGLGLDHHQASQGREGAKASGVTQQWQRAPLAAEVAGALDAALATSSQSLGLPAGAPATAAAAGIGI